MRTKSPASFSPWREIIPAQIALNLSGSAPTHGSWGFQRPVIWQRRLTNIFRHRGAVAFWSFNLKLEPLAGGQALKSHCRQQESPVRKRGVFLCRMISSSDLNLLLARASNY
jgi:hypothetical protein